MSASRDILLATFTEQRDALTRFLVRRVGCTALAEDLAQETWVRAATANSAQAIGNAKSYLFRIALNLALDHKRHVGQNVEVATPDEIARLIPDPAPSPETAVLHHDELIRLLRAVDDLSPRRKEVFILAKVHGLTYGEIASTLGISKNTVMVHMTGALACLDGYFAAQSTARE